MERIDRVRNTRLIYHYDRLRMQCNKISLGHGQLPTIPQPEREGVETILQTAFDLLEHAIKINGNPSLVNAL